MGAHKKYDLESIKQERWFYIIHRNQCTLCGKEFSNGEETFMGHLDDGALAHTCKECSSNMSDARLYSISGHNHRTIPRPSAKLWRYMDLAKFLSLLDESSLYFTRIDHFNDPYEGALGVASNEEAWIKMEMQRRAPFVNLKEFKDDENDFEKEKKEFDEYRRKIRKWRLNNYISCWHQSESESEAMWQLYSRDTQQGIAIQTTFERLYQALPVTANCEFGMVNYIDYSEYNNGTSGKYFHMFDAPWYKRLSFAHEKEFRVISESPDFNMLTDAHDLLIPVDLNLLIDNIYFSPEADKWFVKLVSNIIKKKYGLYCPMLQSNLNRASFY